MSKEKDSQRVCVFDSGIGGLPFVASIQEAYPFLDMNYIADDAGFPYGTKSPEAIRDIVFERVRRIRARLDPDILVISCLTAVQVGLKDLQGTHRSMHIIGASPPIAEAARGSETHRIALFTTARAAEDAFLDDVIAREAPDIEVIRVPAQDLVDYAEQQLPFVAPASAQAAVAPYIKYVLDANADRIVLASSQFVLLEDAIRGLFSESEARQVCCLDSRAKVVAALKALVHDHGSASSETIEAAGFYLTGNRSASPSYIAWASRYALAVPELL